MTRASLRSSFRGPTIVVVALLAAAGVSVSTAPERKAPVDERTIAHVLNRMAFGPIPGDIERVREMGLERYIEQQLQPERLPDAAMRERLARLETLQMSTADIGERYARMEQWQRDIRRERTAKQPAAAESNPKSGRSETDGGLMAAPNQPGSANSAPAQPGHQERQRLLASLSPEERQQFIALRQQNQRVLGDLSEQKLLRAVYSERQLEEVLVDFWFNHFNVFAGKGPTRVYLTEYERDVIRPHVLGKFRDLLGATAHSPAMLFYLDNWQSSDPNAATAAGAMRRGNNSGAGNRRMDPARRPGRPRRDMNDPANQGQGGAAGRRFQEMSGEERAAALKMMQQRARRGLNENYARELMELHTLGVNGGYTQQDIVEVAKCFTGWTIQEPRRGGSFRFDERRHTPGAKTVLGKKIDKGGEGDGEAVLDLLAAHPSTATFIATKLARRFVADEPPKALVERAAATFRSTHGDLREVVRTILTSREFISADAMRAKVKTPFEFVASALRATGAQIEDGTVLVRNLQGMGMPLYLAQPPTGYIDRADVWVNTGALLNRMNFAIALVNNRLRGVRVDLSPVTGGGGDVNAARDALLATLLSNDVSDTTRATLARGSEVTQVAALTLGSPEFQRR